MVSTVYSPIDKAIFVTGGGVQQTKVVWRHSIPGSLIPHALIPCPLSNLLIMIQPPLGLLHRLFWPCRLASILVAVIITSHP